MKHSYQTPDGILTCETDLTASDCGGYVKVIFNDVEVGFAVLHIHDMHIKIHKLGINEEHRNRGFGNFLMDFILKWCEAVEIFSANIHACSDISDDMTEKLKGLTQEKLITFYEKFGFVKCEKNNWMTLDFKRNGKTTKNIFTY